MSNIIIKRQSGSNSRPVSLNYGELAASKDGMLYIGNENGVPGFIGGGAVSENVTPGGLAEMYTLFPNELSPEQKAAVEADPVLLQIYQNSRVGKLAPNNYFVNPYANRLEIKSSQNWTCPSGVTLIDALLVGGGAGGSSGNGWVGGGGGGRFLFKKRLSVTPGQSYPISIGSGGAPNTDGGATTAFGFSASGGGRGNYNSGGDGGNGGGGCSGAGGSYGSNGDTTTANNYHGGRALDNFTVDPYTGIPYCGGGGGSYGPASGNGGRGGGGSGGRAGSGGGGTPNTGGGGGGNGSESGGTGGTGGSGIVIIYY